MKKWEIISKRTDKKIKTGKEILEILLKNRNLKTKKEIEEFLNPPSPYSLTALDLGINEKEVKKAVLRIAKAIKTGEKIIIWGDYDTDGVCATAILWKVLSGNKAKVLPYIPRREEGYGLKKEKIDEFALQGISLVITVDHGIVASCEVDYARKKKIEMIITDHHEKGKKAPEALSVIHSTKIAGCAVAWFLAQQFGRVGLDLVTIGTVTDVMPLLGVNRSFVFHGLPEVRKTKNLGLWHLYQLASLNPEKIGTYEIGFIIGPRLNASGRMEDAMDSLRLLCTNDSQRAITLAQKIDRQNRERQVLTTQLTLHARELWLKEDGKGKLIFVSHESYEEGVVGLIAGKLSEEFYRPAIVLSQGEKFCRASCRSINGFNIIEAIRTCSDLLGSHGGHSLAAGFTVEREKMEELRKRLSDYCESELSEGKMRRVLKIDLPLEPEEINQETYQELKRMEPFGFGNFEPVFLSKGFSVLEARTVGSLAQHLKFRLVSESKETFEAIGFGLGEYFPKLSPEVKVSLVYNLTEDNWNNHRRLQLKVKDLKIDGEKV